MAVATDRLSTPTIAQPMRYGWRKLVWHPALPRQKIISDVFRLSAFSAALLQVLAFPDGPGYHASELTGIIIVGGFYSVLKIAQPFKWQQTRAINVLLLSMDIAASVLLVHFTGGIHSPFILYTLLPVLTAALLKNYAVTILVSLFTGGYVLAGNIYNAASNYSLSLQAVNDFLVYMIALGLVAALPYAINLPTGQRLRSSAAMTERRRIAYELHDNVCQTLCGLRWQVQCLAQRTPVDDRLSDELKRVLESVNTADHDARGLLEVLSTLGDNGRFLPNMRHYLEGLKRYSGISYQLEGEDTDIELAGPVERELSMICIEALTNIKKHAGATNVQFSVESVGGHVLIKITDDGVGFNDAESRHAGHGLAIMRERAEALGGTLRVTSAVGKGTEIYLDIPVVGGRGKW